MSKDELNLYVRYIEPVAETFAYCLLRNHFHLLVRIKSETEIFSEIQNSSETIQVSTSPSTQFSNFFNAYAKAINNAYGRTGSFFQHPFGRIPVTNSGQFHQVVLYIHHNPQKHKFVDDFREWKYSSYGLLLSDLPTMLNRDAVLEWFGNRSEYTRLHVRPIPATESARFEISELD